MAAQFPNVTLYGLGLMAEGLFFQSTQNKGISMIVVDGLGLETSGFVFNASNTWAPAFVVQQVVWSGCSTCAGVSC